jgi:hypothetical protein
MVSGPRARKLNDMRLPRLTKFATLSLNTDGNGLPV